MRPDRARALTAELAQLRAQRVEQDRAERAEQQRTVQPAAAAGQANRR
jgi:hypothetical protein